MSVSQRQRNVIRSRAGNCCEYCRIAESDRLSTFHVDHIIALKHGGSDDDDNLCLACYKCNAYKGSNIAAVDPHTGQAVILYNPRQQQWDEHFKINLDATLSGLTPHGRVTIIVLRINDTARIQQRQFAMKMGEYPC